VGSGVWSCLAAHNLCSLVSRCTLPVWSLEAHREKAKQVDVGQRAPLSGMAALATSSARFHETARQEEVACMGQVGGSACSHDL
jgi:hypothetical protein